MALGTIGEVRIVVRVDMKDLQAQLDRVKKQVEKFKPVMKVKVDAGTFAAADAAVKKTTTKAEKEFKDATNKIEKEVRQTANFIADQMGRVERVFSGVAQKSTKIFDAAGNVSGVAVGQPRFGALVPSAPGGLPQTIQTASFVAAVQELSKVRASVQQVTEKFGGLALSGPRALDRTGAAADRAAEALRRAKEQAQSLQRATAVGGGFGGGRGGGGFGGGGFALGGDLGPGNIDRINRSINGLGDTATRSAFRFRSLVGAVLDFRIAIAALGVGLVAKGIIDIGDSFQNLKARLRIVTKDQNEFNKAFGDVKRLAIETATPLEEIANLYARLKLASETLGISQDQLTGIVEGVGKAIQVSGSVAAEAAGTILQFSQAVAGNFSASAQEFNSILEQSPRLAKALGDGLNKLASQNFDDLGDRFKAAGFGANIATTEIKKLGEKKVIDAIDVLNALLTELGQLNKEFTEIPNTVGRAGNRLSTAFKIIGGEANEAAGLNESLAMALDEVREIIVDPSFKAGLTDFFAALKELTDLIRDSIEIFTNWVEVWREIKKVLGDVDQSVVGKINSLNESIVNSDLAKNLRELLGLPSEVELDPIETLNPFKLFIDGLGQLFDKGKELALDFSDTILETLGRNPALERLSADLRSRFRDSIPQNVPLITRNRPRGGADDDAKKAKEKVDDLIQSLKEEIRVLKQVEALRKNEADLIKAENILKDAKLKLDEKTRDTISELNREISSRELGDQINELQREIKFQEGLNRALEKGSDAARLYEAVGRARIDLSAGTAELLPKETQEYLRLVAALERLVIAGEKAEERAEALKEAIEAEDEIKKTIKANKELIAAYKISNREARIVAKTQEIIEDGFMGSREAARAYAEELAKQEDIIDAISEANQRLIDLQEDLGLALKSAFSDAIVEGEKLKDVMEDLSKEIFDLVLQAVVLDPIADLLRPAPGTSIFGAAGSNPFGLIGTLFEKEPGTAGAGGLSEKTKEGLEGLGKESQRAQETIAEATESTKGLASGTEMTGQLLSGTLAPAALSTATSETLLNTTTGVLTASFQALVVEVNKATLAMQQLGGSSFGGSSFGGGGGTPARFGGGPPLQQLGNGFFTTTGRKMGGLIAGPGSSNSDSILTALSNGEFVVNAAQTKKFLPLLEAINDNDFVRRQFGGLVGSVARTSDVSGGQELSRIDNSQNVEFHITGDNPQAIADEVMMRIQELQGTATARQQRRALGGAFTRARGDGF